MQSKGEERREFQRLRLEAPIPGTFGADAVTIVEVGVLGARVQHAAPLAIPRGELRFSSDGGDIVMRAEVVRTIDANQTRYTDAAFVSGLRFVAAIGESGNHLRAMLSRLVVLAIENRHDSSGTTGPFTRPSGAYWETTTLRMTMAPPMTTMALTRSPRRSVAATNVTRGSA